MSCQRGGPARAAVRSGVQEQAPGADDAPGGSLVARMARRGILRLRPDLPGSGFRTCGVARRPTAGPSSPTPFDRAFPLAAPPMTIPG